MGATQSASCAVDEPATVINVSTLYEDVFPLRSVRPQGRRPPMGLSLKPRKPHTRRIQKRWRERSLPSPVHGLHGILISEKPPPDQTDGRGKGRLLTTRHGRRSTSYDDSIYTLEPSSPSSPSSSSRRRQLEENQEDESPARALDPRGGRAFTVITLLDLGLRMLESPRGQELLWLLACDMVRAWCPDVGQLPIQVLPGEMRGGAAGVAVGVLRAAKAGVRAVARPKSLLQDTAAAESRPVITSVNQLTAQLNLGGLVQAYLRSIRRDFPLVILDGGPEDGEGNLCQYENWAEQKGVLSSDGEFNPKKAAVLHLNWELVDKLHWIRVKTPMLCTAQMQLAKTVRFRRLQFHMSTVIALRLCHLFVSYLRAVVIDRLGCVSVVAWSSLGDSSGLAATTIAENATPRPFFDRDHAQRVIDDQDLSSTFELAFLGGHPKMFLDIDALGDRKYMGDSYLYRTRPDGAMAATHLSDTDIEIYLRSDFSIPLVTEEADLFSTELHETIRRTLGRPKHERQFHGAAAKRKKPGVTDYLYDEWDVRGRDYARVRAACYDPSVRLVDMDGF